MQSFLKKSITVAAISAMAVSANAALYLRDHNMVYDDVFDITWLLDANYAMTSGYAPPFGMLRWEGAVNWADNLDYGGFSDWRLPSAHLHDPEVTELGYNGDGSTDRGWNITHSELGHMFYVYLGNTGRRNVDGSFNDLGSYGLFNSTYTNGSTVIDFLNVRNNSYWFEEPRSNSDRYAWSFQMATGRQNALPIDFRNHFAWAVRDGDVGGTGGGNINTVPVPGTAWLLMFGVVGMMGLSKGLQHVNRRQATLRKP